MKEEKRRRRLLYFSGRQIRQRGDWGHRIRRPWPPFLEIRRLIEKKRCTFEVGVEGKCYIGISVRLQILSVIVRNTNMHRRREESEEATRLSANGPSAEVAATSVWGSGWAATLAVLSSAPKRLCPEPPGEEHRNFLAEMSSPELPEFLSQELSGNRENQNLGKQNSTVFPKLNFEREKPSLITFDVFRT
uniref:Uncharacterized protein n=1 Tax=Oryza sativa subsp. japonica TaxID=39947 RepID=Q5W694_ORYSJ|nr:hypothetical protein [Oryza sativa Japonica Group]AAV44189.1 hypothetical protein [Oryza sativa Japonica Group]